jgi:hypothetical protein
MLPAQCQPGQAGIAGRRLSGAVALLSAQDLELDSYVHAVQACNSYRQFSAQLLFFNLGALTGVNRTQQI